MALYLGRRLCGLKLAEVTREAEIRNYGVVATNSRRCQRRLERDRAEKSRMAEVLRLLNCERAESARRRRLLPLGYTM